jgi:quercetin dioxygenase-like cupin family protein
MFVRREDVAPVPQAPGVTRRVLGMSPALMLVEIAIDSGGAVPTHSHPHEQVGYVVSGRFRLDVAGEVQVLGAGDSYGVPGGVVHSASAEGGPAVVVETFTPHREDFR